MPLGANKAALLGTAGASGSAYAIEYYVVAGGAGAGGYANGGGGAGGYRTGTSIGDFNVGDDLVITIGAAGTGTSSPHTSVSSGKGGDSSITISGGTVDIDAWGGAAGGSHNAAGQGVDGTTGNGGGGGGAAGTRAGGAGTDAGCGTVGTLTCQGFDGGAHTDESNTGAGGGGGASGAGHAGDHGAQATHGVTTATLTTGVTGHNVSGTYYVAGGGGGGGYDGNNSLASNGGGGAGSHSLTSTQVVGEAGDANTGGGAGGGGDYSSTGSTGANGGSGVVLLKIATGNYTGTTTGSPNVVTSGGYKYVRWTGTGSYTA